MDQDEAIFLESLKREIIEEGRCQLESCESLLLEFEKNQDKENIRELKRALHSFKGSAQAADFYDLAMIIHHWEDQLAVIPTDIKNFVTRQVNIIDEIRALLSIMEDGEDIVSQVKDILKFVKKSA